MPRTLFGVGVLPVGPAILAIAVVLVAGASRLDAQQSCNAPAKDATVQLDLPGTPFEPVIMPDGCHLLVTLTQTSARGEGAVAVVQRDNGKLSVVRTVSIEGGPTGAVLTHDGKLLVIASGGYIAFVDAERLIAGDPEPVIGYMGSGAQVGFIFAEVSPDDKTLFVAAERAEAIVVIDLAKARAHAFAAGSGIGSIPVANAPTTVVMSPDGKYLYSTSEVALAGWHWSDDCKPEQPAGRGRGRGAAPAPFHPKGVIFVIDAARAVTDPANSVVSRTASGCSPVRIVPSPDGKFAYVSTRNDNQLLAYDASKLVSDTAHALLGRVDVGVAPVGVAAVDSGARVVVTSSNRFAGNGGDRQPITFVDAARLRAGGKGAVLGDVEAGGFPRELRVTPDGRTLFVTNFSSRSLEMIDLSRTPGAKRP